MRPGQQTAVLAFDLVASLRLTLLCAKGEEPYRLHRCKPDSSTRSVLLWPRWPC